MPPPPERLPRESVPKQLTLRQVHEHRGAPTKTGQGLFHKTSHYTPNQTTTELPLHERRRLCSTEYHGSFDKVIMRKQCASNLTFLSSICLFRYNSSTDACLSIILPILAQYWHQFRWRIYQSITKYTVTWDVWLLLFGGHSPTRTRRAINWNSVNS